MGSIPGLERSPGKGHGNPLQYCCLENPMDRGAWWASVHGVSKSQTRLSDSWSLFTFGQLSCFDTPISPYSPPPSQFVSGPSPGCACTLQSRWISSQRHMVGGIARLTVFWHSLPYLAPRSLLHMSSVSFALRRGNIWPLDLLRVLSLSVPAIRYPVDNP